MNATDLHDFEAEKSPRGFYTVHFPISRGADEYLITHTTDAQQALDDVDTFINEAKDARKQLEGLITA